MLPDGQPCPLDHSRLVSLSGSSGERGVDLSVCYCPRCDVAIVFLAPAGVASVPSGVLQWHRRGDQLELREEDRGRWGKLPRQFRECWESNLRQHVRLFLDSRFSEVVGCPLDGGTTPVLRRWDEAAVPWLFAWCQYCGMGFLYARDQDYGWEHAADVTWDAAGKKYALAQLQETGGNHPVNPEVVRDLPPLPAASQRRSS